MRRVLAVALIATLTTMMIGIDRTSWASQDHDQDKRAKQRAEVTKALGEMSRGSTATIERQDGRKMDVVIEEITPDSVTVMRQEKDHVVTETIPISDIAKIKKASAFCCGERSPEQLGNTSLPESPLPEARCTSVNTMRPQAGPPTGVGKP